MAEPGLRAVLLNVGANVSRLRTKQGWTQAQLAEAIEVETRYVQSIEAGSASPSLRRLVLLAEVLEVDVRELFRPRPKRPRQRNPGRPKKR